MKVFSKKAVVNGFVFAATLSLGTLAHASSWVLNLGAGDGQVNFHAVGKPKLLKINGKGGKPSGSLIVENGKVSGKAIFDLASLNTGIDLRDSHMKEKYLEVAKHPKAILEITEIKLPNPLPAGDFENSAPFKGRLTVKGVAQSVSGTAKLKKSGSSMQGNVEFSTTVKGFNIELPSYMGVTVADEVQVKVEFNSPFTQGSQRSTASTK